MKLKINPEFKSLIPPLSIEEFQGLEDSIKKEGCRDAIVVWKGYIVDGHNRHEICRKIGIEPNVKEMEFASEKEVKIWIIQNQFSRRNLLPPARCELALTLQELLKPKAKENLKMTGGDRKSEEAKSGLLKSSKPIEPINTRREAAKAAGIGESMLYEYEKVQEQASPEIKEKVRNGDMKIHAAYEITKGRRTEDGEKLTVKMCSVCKEEKPISDFPAHGGRQCRKCTSLYKDAKKSGLDLEEYHNQINQFSDEIYKFKNPETISVSTTYDILSIAIHNIELITQSFLDEYAEAVNELSDEEISGVKSQMDVIIKLIRSISDDVTDKQ